MTLSIPDGYYRNVSCTLSLISTFLLQNKKLILVNQILKIYIFLSYLRNRTVLNPYSCDCVAISEGISFWVLWKVSLIFKFCTLVQDISYIEDDPDLQERHYHQYQREFNRRSCDISDNVCQEQHWLIIFQYKSVCWYWNITQWNQRGRMSTINRG